MDYLEAMFGLSGRTAVVSGGAGVIGTAMADALLRAGANVDVWSRTVQSINLFISRYADIPDLKNRVHGIQLDTGDEEAVASAFEQSAKRFSIPEILINAVGGNKGKKPFLDLDLEQFKDILDMNLLAGLVVPTKSVCRHWIDKEIKGSIINLTSMTSYNPLSGVWAYDAAKAATLFLASSRASGFVTGVSIPVDGGYLVHNI